MLHFILKWKFYRNLKSGLLLDFFLKNFFSKAIKQISYIFTIFFGDKFILETFLYNFSKFLNLISNKLKININKNFLKIFRTVFFILSYLLILTFIFLI